MDSSYSVIGTQNGLLVTGLVGQPSEEGIIVTFDDGVSATCDVLESGPVAPRFATGERVLVWRKPEDTATRPVVLGRIGSLGKGFLGGDTPDELLLEARHSLTLRVGAGSITIREDGKILIKGKDLVSHAQRLNRIKGGAVQIN